MSNLLTRTFTPELEVRSSAQGGDGRTIVGIAVPYGVPTRIDPTLNEQFARGAFNHQLRAANRVRVAREHIALGGTLIGRASEMRDDPKGLWVALQVTRTPAGEETLELVRDGVLNHLSIGFRERKNRRLTDGTIERVKADLVEVSVVLEGAYGDLAAATEVRAASDESLCDCDCHSIRSSNLDRARQIAAALPTLPVAV